MEYVAIPKELYLKVRKFIGAQSYDMIKEIVIEMDTQARAVEEKSGKDEQKSGIPSTEVKTSNISD